ncbi:MAG: accB [Alphaproteobacteria bacterium]|nr:accB [Alphaproteobacteria bacterium]
MANTKKLERNEPMPPMTIDHDAIKKLAGLLNETGLTEIEITEGDKSLRVSKSVNVSYAAAPAGGYAPAAPALAAPAASVSALSPDNHPGAVKSPMVGTVYLQSEPGAPRFVSKGAKIKAGDTICIIEAMKVMNPIKADKGGTVTDVLIDDAQPVEFGQVLVIIE